MGCRKMIFLQRGDTVDYSAAGYAYGKGENMENLQEQKQEALRVVGEYLQRLIPGLGTLCGELKGSRQADTDAFRKQCIDGLNWVIAVYNQVSDMIDAKKLHTAKQEINDRLGALGDAIRQNEDAKIADILESAVIPFLKDLSEAIGQHEDSGSF